MADADSLLRNEQRRHLLMTGCLIASCVIGGTVVTNERGLFVPIGIPGVSATAKAFAALLAPGQMPRLRGPRMVSPFDTNAPFDVTADPRDLRRRLIDSLDFVPRQGAQAIQEANNLNDVGPQEIAANGGGGGGDAGGGAGDPGSSVFNPGSSQSPLPTSLPGSDTTPPASTVSPPPVSAVPEPSVWAMMIGGFGLVGFLQRSLRRRRVSHLPIA